MSNTLDLARERLFSCKVLPLLDVDPVLFIRETLGSSSEELLALHYDLDDTDVYHGFEMGLKRSDSLNPARSC